MGRCHDEIAAQLACKFAGVTLPLGKAVDAIDLRDDHSLVNVEQSKVDLAFDKLRGIRLLRVVLAPEAIQLWGRSKQPILNLKT